MKTSYLDTIALLERLHRQCLEVIKVNLDRLGIRDLNNVQAMILFNLGDEEMTISELTARGCYLGVNVSYNLRKLIESGYVEQERSPYDRRAVFIRATPKAVAVREALHATFDRHAAFLTEIIGKDALRDLNQALRRLEGFWTSEAALEPRFSSVTRSEGAPVTLDEATIRELILRELRRQDDLRRGPARSSQDASELEFDASDRPLKVWPAV